MRTELGTTHAIQGVYVTDKQGNRVLEYHDLPGKIIVSSGPFPPSPDGSEMGVIEAEGTVVIAASYWIDKDFSPDWIWSDDERLQARLAERWPDSHVGQPDDYDTWGVAE